LIETDMLGQLPADLDRMTRSVPMGRTAAASEVASVALFLASADSSYCTGAEFIVDGGLYAA